MLTCITEAAHPLNGLLRWTLRVSASYRRVCWAVRPPMELKESTLHESVKTVAQTVSCMQGYGFYAEQKG